MIHGQTKQVRVKAGLDLIENYAGYSWRIQSMKVNIKI